MRFFHFVLMDGSDFVVNTLDIYLLKGGLHNTTFLTIRGGVPFQVDHPWDHSLTTLMAAKPDDLYVDFRL